MLFLPLHANVVSTVEVEVHAEARGRSVESEAVLDLEIDPKLTWKTLFGKGREGVSLGYGPRAVLTNYAGNDAPTYIAGERFNSDARGIDLLHQGTLTLEWQLSRKSKLVSNNAVTYGSATVGTLLIQARWNGEDRPTAPRPFPANQRAKFDLLSIGSFTALFTQVTPRLSLQPAFFFLTWGGPDFEGQKRLNYLKNPGVSLDITYQTSPKDDVVVQIAPQLNVFTSTIDTAVRNYQPFVDPLTGQVINNVAVTTDPPKFESKDLPPVYQLYSEGRYRHRFTPRLSMEFAAGGNITVQDRPSDANDPYNLKNGPTRFDVRVYPVGEILINTGFRGGRNGQGRLIAYTRLATWFNNLIGEAQWRSENIAAVSVAFSKDTFRAQGAALVGLPFAGEERAFTQLFAEAGYSRKISDFSLDTGVRLGYQIAELVLGKEKNVTLQPSAFVGVSWTPKATRL
jgi:hypothetical protein